MIGFILFILIVVVLYLIFVRKIRIKWKTFLKKGFKIKNSKFGTYVYTAVQGQGKSYSCVEFVKDNQDDILLFSNIKIKDVDYIYYNGFKEMLELRDHIDMARSLNKNYIIFKGRQYTLDFSKQVVFIYDELFSELQRGSRINNNVLDFLTQMRKREFILLTTSQIWSDIPITWRRLTRYQIDCRMFHLLFLNILIKTFHDAEQMKWSNDDQEFIAPVISTTITHTRKSIADSYDTMQLIHNVSSSFNVNEVTE